jgi:hypothetical protein
MNKKTSNKPGAISVKVKKKGLTSTVKEKSAPKRLKKYLDPEFATRLIEHMHRAKRAAQEQEVCRDGSPRRTGITENKHGKSGKEKKPTR